MRFEVIRLTPQLAEQFLNNDAYPNRKVNEAKVREIAREIIAGLWKLTHQGIAFTKDGRLLDGQHRCWAVFLCKISIDILAFYDCEEDTFAVLDSGERRVGKDILTIRGYENTKRMAAMIKQIVLHRQGRMGASLPVSAQEIADFADANRPAVEASLAAVHKVKAYPAVLATLHFLFSELPFEGARALADSFVEGFATGAGLEEDSPILRYREKLIINRQKRQAYEHADVLAWGFKAMTAYFNGESLRYLRAPETADKRYKIAVKQLNHTPVLAAA